MKLIQKVGVWVEGARPKTIPAAIVPVLVGTSSVEADFKLLRFLLALAVSVALQIGVNSVSYTHLTLPTKRIV